MLDGQYCIRIQYWHELEPSTSNRGRGGRRGLLLRRRPHPAAPYLDCRICVPGLLRLAPDAVALLLALAAIQAQIQRATVPDIEAERPGESDGRDDEAEIVSRQRLDGPAVEPDPDEEGSGDEDAGESQAALVSKAHTFIPLRWLLRGEPAASEGSVLQSAVRTIAAAPARRPAL